MTRAALFAAVRPFAPQERFKPEDVADLDRIADRWGIGRLDGEYAWLPHALALIKQFEGCKLTAYPDPGSGGDPWTIGWGATGAGIKRGVTWTQDEADARLAKDVERFGDGVSDALGSAATTPQQKGAMVSLAYNIGLGAFAGSTLLKLHKAGEHADAAMQFGRWDKAAGKVMPGLTRRRAAEAAVYRGGVA